MVPKIPPMSYREVDHFLRQQGFSITRQTGSHVRYEDAGRSTVVPRHGRDIPPSLVAKILKDAGINPDTVRR